MYLDQTLHKNKFQIKNTDRYLFDPRGKEFHVNFNR